MKMECHILVFSVNDGNKKANQPRILFIMYVYDCICIENLLRNVTVEAICLTKNV